MFGDDIFHLPSYIVGYIMFRSCPDIIVSARPFNSVPQPPPFAVIANIDPSSSPNCQLIMTSAFDVLPILSGDALFW